jgi:acyl-CoA thioesterase II
LSLQETGGCVGGPRCSGSASLVLCLRLVYGHWMPELPVPRSLADLLDLEVLDRDLFRGFNVGLDPHRLFGGQVAAQALRAAGLTVPDDRYPHSFHGYFLRQGRPDRAVILHVDRDRDGGSFSARHVRAVQEGEVIFSMLASFAVERPGGEFEALARSDRRPPAAGDRVGHALLLDLVEINPLAVEDGRVMHPDALWIRVRDPLPDDRLVRACAVAYVSDLGTGFGQVDAEGVGTGGPSIDHVMWFRRDVDPCDWLLLDLQPGAAAGGLGVYTGTVRDCEGRLAALLAQEMLLRMHSQEELEQLTELIELRRRSALHREGG